MGIWQYAYLFPNSKKQLVTKKAIKELTKKGMVFDDNLIPLKIYPDGHAEVRELSTKIKKPAEVDLYNRLSQNEQIQVICRKKDFFTVCTFANESSNPYISFSWSKRLYNILNNKDITKHREMLRNISNAVNAYYIIFVEEPPDYFEDHFIEIDGIRYLDVFLPSGRRHFLTEIWLKESNSIISEDIELELFTTYKDGFKAYTVIEKGG